MAMVSVLILNVISLLFSTLTFFPCLGRRGAVRHLFAPRSLRELFVGDIMLKAFAVIVFVVLLLTLVPSGLPYTTRLFLQNPLLLGLPHRLLDRQIQQTFHPMFLHYYPRRRFSIPNDPLLLQLMYVFSSLLY